MDWEEIGKRAVELGYDGGGIWRNCNGLTIWGASPKTMVETGCWPDFSYPETEGAALAWIADKRKSADAVLEFDHGWYVIRLIGMSEGVVCDNGFIRMVSDKTKAEAILAAIQSLGLRKKDVAPKKDNSPMGLNKRLLEVGFRSGGCVWYTNRDSSIIVSDAIIIATIESGCVLFPDGSHPSTIGVATSWLRGFPKIGETLHFYKYEKKWYASVDLDETDERLLESFNRHLDAEETELESLVEFAEWAREEGLFE